MRARERPRIACETDSVYPIRRHFTVIDSVGVGVVAGGHNLGVIIRQLLLRCSFKACFGVERHGTWRQRTVMHAPLPIDHEGCEFRHWKIQRPVDEPRTFRGGPLGVRHEVENAMSARITQRVNPGLQRRGET